MFWAPHGMLRILSCQNSLHIRPYQLFLPPTAPLLYNPQRPHVLNILHLSHFQSFPREYVENVISPYDSRYGVYCLSAVYRSVDPILLDVCPIHREYNYIFPVSLNSDQQTLSHSFSCHILRLVERRIRSSRELEAILQYL